MYRAVRVADGNAVVLKVLDPKHPSARRGSAAKRIRARPAAQGAGGRRAARPLDFRGLPALVLEDFGGESLDHLAGAHAARAVPPARRPVARVVADLHERGIIHKDLKPRTSSSTPRPARSSSPTSASPPASPASSHRAAGPAHRGLAAVPVARADGADEPGDRQPHRPLLARRHLLPDAHRAPALRGARPARVGPLPRRPRAARRPTRSSRSCPRCSRRIVAEAPRQDARGPLPERARPRARSGAVPRAVARAPGRIEPFPLGERDVSDRFQIPQKLYGREARSPCCSRPSSAWSRTGAPELVLVSGYSGIGKSSLVHELHKPIVRGAGLLPLGEVRPVQARHPLCHARPGLPGARARDPRRERGRGSRPGGSGCSAPSGVNGQLIVDVIPQVELDHRPAAAGPRAAADRGAEPVPHRVPALHRGVRPEGAPARALPRRPPVGRLGEPRAARGSDDAPRDAPSPRHRRVPRQRGDPLAPAHAGAGRGAEGGRARLGHRARPAVPRSTSPRSSATRSTAAVEDAAPLADLVHEKTAGNPFFAIQFLTALHEERLIEFDARARRWRWDIAKIRAKGFTDNVVDLMVGKLVRLPAGETQEALKQLACLGNTRGGRRS